MNRAMKIWHAGDIGSLEVAEKIGGFESEEERDPAKELGT